MSVSAADRRIRALRPPKRAVDPYTAHGSAGRLPRRSHRRGVRSVLGIDMPVFPKRRFQEGSVSADEVARLFPRDEGRYRRHFQTLHAAAV